MKKAFRFDGFDVNGFEHEEKGDFATSPKHFKVAWVKLMTLCIAGPQQNGAITSIRGLQNRNKACHCPCYCCGTEPVYMNRSCEQHRMLTDFEGATRKNEVGFCIWTSKEFHQYQVVGRKLPTASDEHPKIY
ncbi:hypothetical protein ACE6H2_021707 [Prunus campanulata]